jgi:hypothetical protein
MTKDILKKHMISRIGPGGLNCPCCGPAPSERLAFKRIAKKRARRELDKEIQSQLFE